VLLVVADRDAPLVMAAAMATSLGESAARTSAATSRTLTALAAPWPFTLDQVHQPVVLVHERTDRIVPLRHGQALAAALAPPHSRGPTTATCQSSLTCPRRQHPARLTVTTRRTAPRWPTGTDSAGPRWAP